MAQTPVALVFCILNLHLCSTEKISGLAKLWGLWSTNHLYWMSRLVSVPIPIISWHLAGSLSPYLKDLSRGWSLQYFLIQTKVTGGLGRRRSRAVLGELEGRWVALLLSILGGVRVRVTWYMSALVDIFWIFRYFRNKESLKKKVGYVFHIALLHFHLHCIGKHSSNIYFCKIGFRVATQIISSGLPHCTSLQLQRYLFIERQHYNQCTMR